MIFRISDMTSDTSMLLQMKCLESQEESQWQVNIRMSVGKDWRHGCSG